MLYFIVDLDNLSGWTAPLFEGVALLVAAVQHWFLQCNMDQTDRDLVLLLYDEVASVRQQNTRHLQTKQVSNSAKAGHV